MKGSTISRAFVAFVVSAAFLFALALGASPELHGRVHKDADQPGHTCAVTLIASGNFNHSAPASLVSAPAPAFEFRNRLELNSVWVQPLFLATHVFAHAPPVIA
jgi:hypothetical protein